MSKLARPKKIEKRLKVREKGYEDCVKHASTKYKDGFTVPGSRNPKKGL